MSTEILQQPDRYLDSWIHPPDSGQVSSGSHYGHYRTSSPVISQKKLDRPKSVPATLTSNSGRYNTLRSNLPSNLYGTNRPMTALGSVKAECGRVLQVEHEPTRKHNLENHFPLKRNKPPPWQKALDPPPVPCVIAPGYTLARSKSKVSMNINTNHFFDPEPSDNDNLGNQGERNPLIQQLQQQIDDLTLYLEEERLNHKDTKRKAAQQLEEKVEELTKQHEEDMRMLREEYEKEISNVKEEHKKEIKSLTENSEAVISKMRNEMEFLQGAFESYKAQIQMEMDEKWQKREAEMMENQDALLEEKLKELRNKVLQEHMSEKADLTQLHQRNIEQLKQEHKREINQILRRFSNAARELEDYKKTKDALEERNQELQQLKNDYDNVCRQTAELTRQLADMKIELATFEQTFEERVQIIDDKYKDRIHSLMEQNTELRRLYVKKCGQLFDEKAEAEKIRVDTLQNAKDTMRAIIETRNRAMVNLAATDPAYDKRVHPPKCRPCSAPQTKSETETLLLSAGETDEITRKHEASRLRPGTCKPRFLDHIKQEQEEEEKLLENQERENRIQDTFFRGMDSDQN